MKPRVLMYSTAVCPYCVRAEQLLTAKGVTDTVRISDAFDGLNQPSGGCQSSSTGMRWRSARDRCM